MPSIHTFSSREFTRNVSAAKRAASEGPVFITYRGQPAFALLTMDDYLRLAGHPAVSLLDLMSGLPACDDVEFEAPRRGLVGTAADLS